MSKRKIIITLLLLVLVAMNVHAQDLRPADNATASAAPIDKAQEKADADAKKAREEALAKEAEILIEQNQIQAELSRREALKKEKEQAVAALRARCEQNEKTIDELKKRVAEQKSEGDEVAGTVRGIAQDLGIALSQSMVSGEQPGRKKLLEPLISQTEFPSIELIRQMGDLLFDEIKRNGTIKRSTVTYIDAAGKETKGEITRIGTFNALWHKDGKTGYLEYIPARETFAQFGIPMPGAMLREAARFVAGTSQGMYIDVSSGGAFRQLSDMPGWWDQLKSGGALMWPICIFAAVALLMIMERLWVLTRESRETKKLAEQVSTILQEGRWDHALTLCRNSATCLGRVLAAGLAHRHEKVEVLESVLEESIQGNLRPLDKNMGALQLIAVVEPLLGLLGTVTGMITTFQMLTIYGTGDPRMMSGGISEALVTTEYGLIASIPIILAHGWLQGRIDRIVTTIEEKSMMLVNTVKKGVGAAR
ncbi:MAG: MotA/TolQ/ExbB proton channel family protein [Desulfobacterota bacterium]|nr:MotA/TolQ/ExbB proton channel family protein [Thermodesulfobacteriota bacterium]